MSKTKQDAYTSNLLISLLMRFPEIMSINFDRPRDSAKFTFMIAGKQEKERLTSFNRLLSESLAAYGELTGDCFRVKPTMLRSGKVSILELTCSTTALSLEGIQLLAGVVDNAFPGMLVKDAEAMEAAYDEEMVRQEEIIEYLLSHNIETKQENLIAFREAGKVMVYDK